MLFNGEGAGTPVAGECVDTTDTYAGTGKRNSVGWAAGLGVEWAFLNNMSLGLEYLHADFGTYRTSVVDPYATAARDERETRVPVFDPGPPATPADLDTKPAQGGPNPVRKEVRISDSIDLFRVKLNVRF